MSASLGGRLTSVFFGKLGCPSTDAEARLGEIVSRAREAHPDYEVDDVAFVTHLASCLDGESQPLEALESLEHADLFLAMACASGDARALAEFERRYILAVPAMLARQKLARSQDVVEEIQQALRDRLLVPRGSEAPRIAEYAGRGPLAAWVRVAAVREAIGLDRKARATAHKHTEAEKRAPVPRRADPEAEVIRDRYHGALKAAVKRALAALDEEDRTLLRLHFIEGLTVEQIGATIGAHGSTASRRISRARERVRELTERELAREMPMRKSEFRSLVGLLRSELDVSVQEVLGAVGS
ncbi:MAG TPA: sigma-70 family RNA polymerase sigma factor [Polyangiaceae bacterium]|nr:sigma-70 family RNA polymerase sigma factor [Polyangiaceae bacterium]